MNYSYPATILGSFDITLPLKQLVPMRSWLTKSTTIQGINAERKVVEFTMMCFQASGLPDSKLTELRWRGLVLGPHPSHPTLRSTMPNVIKMENSPPFTKLVKRDFDKEDNLLLPKIMTRDLRVMAISVTSWKDQLGVAQLRINTRSFLLSAKYF